MFGSQPSLLVQIAWLVFTPLVMAMMLFVGIWNLQPPKYEYSNNYEYPKGAIIFGWCVALLSWTPTPVTFIYKVVSTALKSDSVKKDLRRCFQPTPHWVPANPDLIPAYRKKYYGDQLEGVSTVCANGGGNSHLPEVVPKITIDEKEAHCNPLLAGSDGSATTVSAVSAESTSLL